MKSEQHKLDLLPVYLSKNFKDWDDEDIIEYIEWYLGSWKKHNELQSRDERHRYSDIEALASPIRLVLEMRIKNEVINEE